MVVNFVLLDGVVFDGSKDEVGICVEVEGCFCNVLFKVMLCSGFVLFWFFLDLKVILVDVVLKVEFGLVVLDFKG